MRNSGPEIAVWVQAHLFKVGEKRLLLISDKVSLNHSCPVIHEGCINM
jgi:hypothetical protein